MKYRVSWILHNVNISTDLVSVFEAKKMEMTDLSHEFVKDQPSIRTGNVIIKAIRKEENKYQYLETGIYDIFIKIH